MNTIARAAVTPSMASIACRRWLPSSLSCAGSRTVDPNRLYRPTTAISPHTPTATTTTTKRSHMNHGGGGNDSAVAAMKDGPRTSNVPLGFDATKHSGNLLRLLESSHAQLSHFGGGGGGQQHLSSTVWDVKRGQYWAIDDADTNRWTAHSPDQPLPKSMVQHKKNTMTTMPTLESMSFSDECTALIKLVASDGQVRYLSLLKLMDDDSLSKRESMGGPPFLANDGWLILREVVASSAQSSTTTLSNNNRCDMMETMMQLSKTIQTYWSIEHGGGIDDRNRAEQLFHPNASLLSVGATSELEYDHHDKWSAPVGSLLEIPLETYLEGVASQTPHSLESSEFDALINIDVSGNAAAVTLTVGNGSQTRLFKDHLLLGKEEEGGDGDDGSSCWKILSKTFSPQMWPKHTR